MDIIKKNAFIILIVILALVFALNLKTFKKGHDWGDDFAAYLHLTVSLVDGKLDEYYSLNQFRYDNSTSHTGGLTGNVGYPFILSPVYYLFGLNIHAMKICTNMFFFLALTVLWMLIRDRLGDLQSLALIAIIAVNSWFFEFKDNVLSDIPFFFFSLFSLFLIKRFLILKDYWINRIVSYSLIGVFIFISYLIRSVGLVLLPVLFLVQVIESRSSLKSLVLEKSNYTPYGVFFALTVLFGVIFPSGPAQDYLNIFYQTTISRIIYDIEYYSVLPSRFFPFLLLQKSAHYFTYNKFSLVIYAAMFMFVILGMIRNRKKDYMYLVFIFLTMLVTMTFSRHQGFRLIIPVFPFFLYFLFVGLSCINLSCTLSEKLSPLNIRADYIFSAALILISLFYISLAADQNITLNETGPQDGPYTADSVALFDYIKSNTGKEDSIVFFKPRAMTLYTGRKSLMVTGYDFDQILASPADFVAYDIKDKPYGVNIDDLRGRFRCIYENSTYVLCAVPGKEHTGGKE